MHTPKSDIIPLLNFLLEQAHIKIDLSSLKLEVMDDGGMGSHKFITNNKDSQFGKNVAQCEFIDSDGIHVSAALFLDQYGALYELDLFKSDFSKLLRWPSTEELSVA
jgi:hypothetical protein